MALLCVCAVRDRAASAFGRPMFLPSKGIAIRSFADEINRVDHENLMNRHPDDFELFYLGTFDEEFGIFNLELNMQSLASGKDCVMKSA